MVARMREYSSISSSCPHGVKGQPSAALVADAGRKEGCHGMITEIQRAGGSDDNRTVCDINHKFSAVFKTEAAAGVGSSTHIECAVAMYRYATI